MDWAQILTVFIIVATNLTTVIVLHCHLDSKTNSLIEAIRLDIKEFKSDMSKETKEFHGKLCAIEERNKEK